MANTDDKAKKQGRLKGFIGKTKEGVIKHIDVNDDGAFDKKDVSDIVGKVIDGTKSKVDGIKANMEKRKDNSDLKCLNPIFSSDLKEIKRNLPRLICITEKDKKHQESRICDGSIGHIEVVDGLKVLNIYREQIGLFNINFFPRKNSELYYVDPSDYKCYIDLDIYFEQLKQARVCELEKIAYDLGAKHFKVTYKEENTESSKKDVSEKLNAKLPKIVNAKADVDVKSSSDKFKSLEIAAESTFIGHEPIRPNLKYLQHEPDILNLIELRMGDKPITHKKMEIRLIESSGIKMSDAVKIDAAIKRIKVNSNTKISSEVKRESMKSFVYEIEF
ncbi:hypothetical protein HMPREF0380_01211 [Eubacterium infirmum F0142]|nr:hypothetical protein HMPREF0380_01211 [Eubacterium infirmum F0142]